MNSLINACFEQLLKTLPDYIFWKDTQSKYLGCNSKFARQVGLDDPNDIIGLTDHELSWDEGLAEIYLNEDRYILTTGKSIINKEVPFTDIDGHEKVILIHKHPLTQENRIIGIIGIFVDITDEKRAEELNYKYIDAEKRVEYTKVAAGSIAHDLRTPLLALKSLALSIESMVPTLLDGYEKAKAASLDVIPIRKQRLLMLNEVIKAGVSEVDFANHYIDLVLGNLKYDGIDTSDFEPLLMSDILNESLESYPYKEDQKSLVHLDVQHDFTLMGDRVYFKNLINNLLRNSFSFIKSERKGEIYITCLDHELHVKDTAKGASPEICKTIFEPYKSNRRGGTGLGLAFCKNIIESFGGTASVDSIEGQYINFIFHFKG